AVAGRPRPPVPRRPTAAGPRRGAVRGRVVPARPRRPAHAPALVAARRAGPGSGGIVLGPLWLAAHAAAPVPAAVLLSGAAHPGRAPGAAPGPAEGGDDCRRRRRAAVAGRARGAERLHPAAAVGGPGGRGRVQRRAVA